MLVNLSSRDVRIAIQLDSEIPLVVSEIKVRLSQFSQLLSAAWLRYILPLLHLPAQSTLRACKVLSMRSSKEFLQVLTQEGS